MASGVRTRAPVSLCDGRPESLHYFRPVVVQAFNLPCRTPRLPAVAQHLHRRTTRLLAAAGEPGHPAERLQHLLHLDELLQQTIHILDRRSAALRDALAAAAVDDVLFAALFRRHRTDDRL